MVQTKIQGSGFPVKTAIIIVLLLTILPLALFILVQFAPPAESSTSDGTSASAESATGRSAAAERRAQRAEDRASRQELKTTHTASVPHGMAPDPDPADFRSPDDISVVGVGAVVPNAPRGKRATPYPPGEVPGDSGVMVQYAGSPDDPIGAPPPPPPAPQDDLWGGRPATPISPANMRGIGGVRRIDPDDPFFQQDIPNPFNR